VKYLTKNGQAPNTWASPMKQNETKQNKNVTK